MVQPKYSVNNFLKALKRAKKQKVKDTKNDELVKKYIDIVFYTRYANKELISTLNEKDIDTVINIVKKYDEWKPGTTNTISRMIIIENIKDNMLNIKSSHICDTDDYF